MARSCPLCDGLSLSILVSSARLDEECRERDRFVKQRLTRPAAPQELKDLTDFFHQEQADILICNGCKLLIRRQRATPEAHTYSKDEYDPSVIEQVYPQYLNAFRAKETPYRGLLASNARVLEIGSHYGAFLETAAEWGWNAAGVDVGKDTAQFARSKGFTVYGTEIEQCNFANDHYDAVFIWNCFEQIEDPKPTLNECRRILKPGGLLVVRTPNGLFYGLCEQLLAGPNLAAGSADLLTHAMAYENLLGFPYLYGYSKSTLERLISTYSFTLEGTLNSELITLPLPESPEWVEQEEREINSEMRLLARAVLRDTGGELTGPWIEIWFRSTSA